MKNEKNKNTVFFNKVCNSALKQQNRVVFVVIPPVLEFWWKRSSDVWQERFFDKNSRQYNNYLVQQTNK